MKSDLKFSDIPRGFTYCLSGSCVRAGSCLRRQAVRLVPADKMKIEVISPNYVSAGEGCSEYLSDSPAEEAFGVSRLYDAVPYSQVTAVRNSLIAAFGKKKYYRLYRQEIGFTAEMQDTVRAVFLSHGISSEPQWDCRKEVLHWSNPSVVRHRTT